MGELPIVDFLTLSGWNVSNRFEQSDVIEPAHPLESGNTITAVGVVRRRADGRELAGTNLLVRH